MEDAIANLKPRDIVLVNFLAVRTSKVPVRTTEEPVRTTKGPVRFLMTRLVRLVEA